VSNLLSVTIEEKIKMIKKTFLFALFVFFSVSAVFATDFSECYLLNDYFNKTAAEIHAKIDEYQTRLSSNKEDYYANLAIAILYSALSSPMENPEKSASQKIVEYSKNFEKKEANNPLALTYYGLGCSLISRDSTNPFVQWMYVNKAMSIFDKAVRLCADQPTEWFVYYMRANFYINLPDTFKKRAIAESDFEFVNRYYQSHPEIEGYMCNGFYNLGEIEKSRGNIDQAVKYWTQSVSINEKIKLNSKEAVKSAERLKIFKE
jgi:tetratricopeptide (TPR) repeat protein